MQRHAFTLLACLMAISLSAGLAFAQDLTVALILTGGPFMMGEDTIDVSAIAFNYGPTVNVDVHVAVLPPGGGILEVPDWNTEFRPLFSNLTLPTYFSYDGALASYNAGDYPFDQQGDYYFAAAFTEPGNLNFVSEIYLFPFSVVQQGEPDATGGQLNLSHTQMFFSGFGWQTMVSAGGMFYESYETKATLILGEEGCEVTVHEVDSGTGTSRFIDAGDKIDMMGSPAGNIELPRTSYGGTILYGPSRQMTTDDYAAGNQYTFTGYGGPDVGDFSVSVVAPEVIELYTPALDPTPVINVGQDLEVTWNGTGSGQVYVGISSYNQPLMPTHYTCLTCTFDDDGEATIPSDLLQQLYMYDADLSISRVDKTTFSADGLDEDGGLAYAITEKMGDVTLQ